MTANGPGTLATVSLATRRVIWQVSVILVLSVVSSATVPLLQPGATSGPVWIDYVLGLLSAIAMIVGGMYIGSRRELLWTLRDRAERAEAEQALRVEQGQLNERARIAREMHDVLGHRISLIAMHAGALAYRTDLTPAETHQTAELIQATSHEALTDLRQVLGVLREGDPSGSVDRPQPTFGDLSALVLESERAGMRIQYDDRVVAVGRDAGPGRPDGVPDRAGGPHQRPQARARRHGRGPDERLADGGCPHQDPQPGPHASGVPRRPADAWSRPGPGRPGGARQARRRQPHDATGRRIVRARRMAAVDGVSPPIRVLVVDDDALVRSGLLMILGGAPDIEVVGEAVDGHDGCRGRDGSSAPTSY